MSRNPVILVLGGARSGKSRFAVRCATGLGLPPLFLATGEAGDDEMAERIARHRADRAADWATVEEPRDVAGVLRRERGRAIVLDCLTMWLSNRIEDDRAGLEAAIDDLVAALEERENAVVAVSNEVGLGIVPEHALGREFRDRAGFLNQRVAEVADTVHLLVAGRALSLK